MRLLAFATATGILLGAAGAMCLIGLLRSVIIGDADDHMDLP